MSPCLRSVNSAHRNPYGDLGALLSLFGAGPAYIPSPHNKRPSQHAISFIPNFNVLETSQAYILEGELPGLSDKKTVDIEFTDHQTLVVKGRISRNTTETATTPSNTTTTTSDETTTITSGNATPTTFTSDTSPEQASSKTATVEEVVDEADSDRSAPWTVISPSINAKGKSVAKDSDTAPTQAKTKPETRYWVTERNTGFFQRNFKFPGPIDQDNVSAKLVDGILTIDVPKQTKVQTRRVEIQ